MGVRDILALYEIWMADTKISAETAFDLFVKTDEDEHPGTVQWLLKNQEYLLALYDFPAAHWKSIRNANPIESSLQS